MSILKIKTIVPPLGAAHGALFIIYVGLAIYFKYKLNWSFKILILVLLASVIPFGTFYIDREILAKKSIV